MASSEEKNEWARTHALRIEELFEQWQRPFGIDSGEYFRYLRRELLDFCENPLKKSLIESIS